MATPLSSFIPGINAFASIACPADPIVPTAFPLDVGLVDLPAGELARPTVGAYTDPFGAEICRLYALGHAGRPLGIGSWVEQDGIQLFTELDLQAVAAGSADFADYYSTDPASATLLVYGCFSGTVTPISPATGGTLGLMSLTRVAVAMTYLIWAQNHSEDVLRAELMGYGNPKGPPVYTDPANLIAAPNNRIPSQGGTATFTSRDDYSSWAWPARQGLEDQLRASFIDWDVPGSDAALAALLAAANTGAIMAIGT